jgi:ABC-2 type transport system ATP-binding protein
MIRCEALTKFYGKERVPALDRLTLEVQKNSVFGFLGPNGAGKTTAIRILTGLMSQTSGTATVAGETVGRNHLGLRSKIGYLGQDPQMYKWMKGGELLNFVGELFGLSRRERHDRTAFLLEMAGLQAAGGKRISSYSGGMLQRLGIAQAMVSKPEVLLLDEPTSALDPIGRKEVLDFIASLRTQCTVFMSTHILADVERVCDTVAIIDKGKLIAEGNTEELRRKYAPRVIEVVLGNVEHQNKVCDYIRTVGTGARVECRGAVIEVHAADPEAEMLAILKFIAEQELSVTRFELVNATLEDVFVTLVGGGPHD